MRRRVKCSFFPDGSFHRRSRIGVPMDVKRFRIAARFELRRPSGRRQINGRARQAVWAQVLILDAVTMMSAATLSRAAGFLPAGSATLPSTGMPKRSSNKRSVEGGHPSLHIRRFGKAGRPAGGHRQVGVRKASRPGRRLSPSAPPSAPPVAGALGGWLGDPTRLAERDDCRIIGHSIITHLESLPAAIRL